ncbi:MAG: VWA domain-containing protein [Candidatus Bipolaricaulota bacterium]|nr:VWA domain-containing protein [Candidatus Bipolaricaulota bacterium]
MSVSFDTPWILVCLAGLALWVWFLREYLRHAPLADRWAALLRIGALAMLCLALAGPRLVLGSSDRYIYFLVDRSASVGVDSAKILEIVQALAPPAEKTSYGVISFGAEPAIEAGFAPVIQLSEFQTEPGNTATDIASAVRLALETFPRSGRREIVLLTDGQMTAGDLTVLARARRDGVPIHVWPLGEGSSEAWVHDLQIPPEVTAQVPFSLRVQIGATTEGQGTLLLYRNEELIHNISVRYRPGVQEMHLTEKLDAPGAYAYRVYLKADADRLKENNELYGATMVPGDPQVLLVERSSGGESPVARLLRSAGFAFVQKAFETFTANPIVLSGYKTVILNNVPLGRLTAEQRRALKRFVADGGGLFLIQGREAVMGLEEQTPEELADLEELLPISYLAPEPYQIPGLALVFVMDRSGSMGDPAGRGVPKIEILKRAALRSLEVLDRDDWVGLIAFDTDYTWIVPLRPLGDGHEFSTNIRSLSANGGTDLYFALKAAFETLEKTPARIKHILVFTDGHNNNERRREYQELYERFAKSTVRVSTLGIDRTPNEPFLMELAAAGRGRYQRVPEFTDLPAFSLREVRRIVRLRWIEGELMVRSSSLTPFFPSPSEGRGARGEGEIPPVQGYVLTHERAASQTPLRIAPDGNPLLAFHTYGLGQVGVLNTDLEGEGSRDWLRWEGLSSVIGPALARVHRAIAKEHDIAVQTVVTDEALEVIADVRDEDRWVSGLDLYANVGTERAVPFHQVASGRYRARFESLASGLYTVHIIAQRDGHTVAEVSRAFAVPYPHEYRSIGVNVEILSQIARETGGQFLERPVLPPPARGIGREGARELWPWALLLALGLFLADLAVRKLGWLWDRPI